MKVVLFIRKKQPGNFSIESLFETIQRSMPSDVRISRKVMRFRSKGFFSRIAIMCDCFLSRQQINHVTGDIHFASLALPGKRTILTIHDIGFVTHPSTFARFILKCFWLYLPVRHCAIITTVSEATKKELLKYVSHHYENKIRVIHNPLKELFVPHPKAFHGDEPVILQIGTKYNKNITRLSLAIASIKCRLEIVGKLTDSQISELRYHKIKYSVYSGLSDEEIVNRYVNADIISFVSTNEGFGFPIIEANAVGRVVITSKISSMPEIAGDAAHLVDPYDVDSIRQGFNKIIEEPTYRNQLIQNGYRNAKRFGVTKIVEKYAEVYREISTRPQ